MKTLLNTVSVFGWLVIAALLLIAAFAAVQERKEKHRARIAPDSVSATGFKSMCYSVAVVLRRRYWTAPKPTMPSPRKANVEGSGTGTGVEDAANASKLSPPMKNRLPGSVSSTEVKLSPASYTKPMKPVNPGNVLVTEGPVIKSPRLVNMRNGVATLPAEPAPPRSRPKARLLGILITVWPLPPKSTSEANGEPLTEKPAKELNRLILHELSNGRFSPAVLNLKSPATTPVGVP